MKIIYEPKGLAREYAPLACNPWWGCQHNCGYCWGPHMPNPAKKGLSFAEWKTEWHRCAHIKDDALLRIESDCLTMQRKQDKRPVLFMFNGDPYCPDEPESDPMIGNPMPFTREALCILQNYGIQPIILTKGGTRACRDFDILMAAGGWFGQTMSMLTVNYKQWEPNTATPFDREQAAGSARDKGINTWYSVEPVLDSGESLHVVATARHVCHFKLGKLSGYDKETKAIEKSINWYDYLMQATTILEEAGYERTCAPGTFEAGTYYIKAELVEAARVIGSRADERTEGEI